jgi:hypothetical protein
MPTILRKDKILQMGLDEIKSYYFRQIVFIAVILDIDVMESSQTCAGPHSKMLRRIFVHKNKEIRFAPHANYAVSF